MRVLGLIGLAAMALAGCQSRVPASNAGVGFGDYADYEIARAQAEAGVATAPTAPLTAPGAIGTSDLAAAGIGATAPGTDADAALVFGTVEASPGNAPPPVIQSSGISDEQDFEAVASRETIESDAARRAAQAAAYQVVQPTALPAPPADTGPNIVDYALNAPNRVGQPWYSRFMFSGQARFERNCASYRSPDEAQRDFLDRGGPERDPRGIDPDGDGFACGWDPAPFLAAVGRN